ncbi:hypothetical protein ACF1BP_32590 [Streptomyces sp. NPDC014735]
MSSTFLGLEVVDVRPPPGDPEFPVPRLEWKKSLNESETSRPCIL